MERLNPAYYLDFCSTLTTEYPNERQKGRKIGTIQREMKSDLEVTDVSTG